MHFRSRTHSTELHNSRRRSRLLFDPGMNALEALSTGVGATCCYAAVLGALLQDGLVFFSREESRGSAPKDRKAELKTCKYLDL